MAGILVASDRNILGRKSAIVSQRKPYSDLDVSLSRDVTNDIAPLKDIEAVKAAVKNLVLTSFGEDHSSQTLDRPSRDYSLNLRIEFR